MPKIHLTKEAWEFISLIFIGLISVMALASLINFQKLSINSSSIDESVRLQISTLNSIQDTLPHLEKYNKIIYANNTLGELYKIQKSENDELVNVVSQALFEETSPDNFLIKMIMRPSTHTCSFINKQHLLKGKLDIKGILDEKYNCKEDILLINYSFSINK